MNKKLTSQSIIKICALSLVILLALSSFIIMGVASVQAAAQKRKLPVYSVDREDKVVALTFDAAYGDDKTREIVKILQDNGVTGTFFLVGFWVDKFPDDVKLLHEAGIEIGNHSRNHYKMSTLSESQIVDEVEYVNSKVEELTGVRPKVFRPPYGDYNNTLIDTINKQGMIPIQWSVDTLDWKGTGPEQILSRIKAKIDKGGIILFHNNSDYVTKALPSVIAYLKGEGYEFKTVSELVYHEDYIIDNNGKQTKK